MWEDDSSLTGLLAAIFRGIAESLRANKIATTLAALAFVTTGILAFSSQFDERPCIDRFCFPISIAPNRCLRAEFMTPKKRPTRIGVSPTSSMRKSRTREAVDLLKNRWPHTHDGVRPIQSSSILRTSARRFRYHPYAAKPR
jgi:hypothetical protein